MAEKKLEEEEKLSMEIYNAYRSFRFVNQNPDLADIKHVICACGNTIDTLTEWFVMLASGLLLCRSCASCNSCRKDNQSISNKLACIDGLVLCYSCLENFGSYLEPPFRVMMRDSKSISNPQQPPNVNSVPVGAVKQDVKQDILFEFQRKNRSQYLERRDYRRPIRRALYERAVARLPAERNPLITAPPYDAHRGPLEKMVCPVCTKAATMKNEKYVVASIARIYHKKCFHCVSCKDILTDGVKEAGKHYEYCSCEPPLVWCTKYDCKQQRLTHHAKSLCWLGPLRPGGNRQNNPDRPSETQRQEKSKRRSEKSR